MIRWPKLACVGILRCFLTSGGITKRMARDLLAELLEVEAIAEADEEAGSDPLAIAEAYKGGFERGQREAIAEANKMAKEAEEAEVADR